MIYRDQVIRVDYNLASAFPCCKKYTYELCNLLIYFTTIIYDHKKDHIGNFLGEKMKYLSEVYIHFMYISGYMSHATFCHCDIC